MDSHTEKPNVLNNETIFENLIVDDERLLTKKEIAYFLNVSVKMIDRKVLLGEIPFYKVGSLVRFRKSEILTWAHENIHKG